MKKRSGCDLSKLQKPKSAEFFEEIENVYGKLLPNQAHAFFGLMIDHLNSIFSPSIYKEIVNSISSLMKKDVFRKIWIAGGFTKKLPFGNPSIHKYILDFLYHIITKDPNSLDVSQQSDLECLITNNPSKMLVVFSMYGCQFNDIDDPKLIVDSILDFSSIYVNSNESENYITLLTNMALCFPDLCSAFNDKINNAFFGFLGENNLNIVKYTYESMANLVTHVKFSDLNVSLFRKQIKISDLADTIIDYLVVDSIRIEFYSNLKVLSSLLRCSSTNVKATLVLIKATHEPDVALQLTRLSNWMTSNLPTLHDTFRLFLSVFYHKSCRKLLFSFHEFPGFCYQISHIQSVGYVSTILKILSMCDITIEMVSSLSDNGFMISILDTCQYMDHIISYQALLAFFYHIVNMKFLAEFLKLCQIIQIIFCSHFDLVDYASKVALSLLKYKKCKKFFASAEFLEILEKSTRSNKSSRKLLSKITSRIDQD